MRFLRQCKGVQGEENKKAARAREPRQPRVLDAPLTWLSLVGLLASRARLRFAKQDQYSTRRGERREDGCIGPSSSEEEALAAQGQPEQPSGPAESAGVALIEAACACETVAPEYSVSGPAGPGRLLDSADGFTKGWIWGAAAYEKNGSTTSHNRP